MISYFMKLHTDLFCKKLGGVETNKDFSLSLNDTYNSHITDFRNDGFAWLKIEH